MSRNDFYNTLKGLGFNPSTIIDCGAAYGEWSGVLKGIYPNAVMMGVDANKWTEGKISGTDITEIQVLSDEDDKELIFYRKKENIENGDFCTGDSLFRENSQHYQEHNTIETKVKTTTILNLLNKHNLKGVDLLKIDTQGSEIIIMKGLGYKLKDVEFIELECSLIDFNIGGCLLQDVIDFLKEDFNIFDIVETHRQNQGLLFQVDVVFQNKKSKIKTIV
jgi:FkbM family methyltransferase